MTSQPKFFYSSAPNIDGFYLDHEPILGFKLYAVQSVASSLTHPHKLPYRPEFFRMYSFADDAAQAIDKALREVSLT